MVVIGRADATVVERSQGDRDIGVLEISAVGYLRTSQGQVTATA